MAKSKRRLSEHEMRKMQRERERLQKATERGMIEPKRDVDARQV